MFKWTDDVIRFRADAAENVCFDEKIAAQIIPHLNSEAKICDAGCGAGYLSIALAPYCAKINAVDSSKLPLLHLESTMRRCNVTNITPICADIFSMEREPRYDNMIFCMFGDTHETLICAKRLCAGRVFMIKKNYREHRFMVDKKPLKRFTHALAKSQLDALAIPYYAEEFSLDMGQPFRSLADAATFINTMNGEAASAKSVEPLLEKTDSPKFPYYLPSEVSLGLIMLDAENIPDSI